MRKPTNSLDEMTLNDLGVAIADKLDALLKARTSVPPDLRDAVLNLRNTADALLSAAEAAARVPTLLDPKVAEPFRFAVGLMLQTCAELPQPMMPNGDQLLLVPAQGSGTPARRRRRPTTGPAAE